MFYDLEVNNVPYYGAVASPRCEDNFVVMVGQAIDYGTPYSGEVTYKHYKSKEEAKDWLKIPDDVGLLVAHNLSFEMDWNLEQCYDEIAKFIKRGGRFWCTQLAEYRLTRQQEIYPTLEATAMKYGGDAKIDLVKRQWEKGILTKDIDSGLLKDYLVGTPDMEGDIGNTRLAFYGQWVAATERGMVNAILEQNNALIFNSVCMRNGLKVDMEVAEANLARLQGRIDEIDVELREIRKAHGFTEEEDNSFKVGSYWDMSPYLYGGVFKYKSKVPSVDKDGNVRYDKTDAIEDSNTGKYYMFSNLQEYTTKQLEDYFLDIDVEPVRYKSGVRKGEIKVVRVDSGRVKMINGTRAKVLQGIVNFDLYPETVVEGWKQEYISKNVTKWEGKEYPLYATKEDAVEVLLDRRETPEETKLVLIRMLERAILDKAVGSFFDKQELNAKGLPKKRSGMFQYITDKHFIHPSLNATATETGRLSCTKPAMQTMPRDDRKGVMKSNVKEMFVSRFGDQGRIVEIDYSNLEGRGLADLTKDSNLAKIVLNDMDVLCLSVSEKLGVDYEYVLERAKGNPNHPDHAEYAQMRQDMKPAQYAYNYGASAHGIAYGTGWSKADAEAFVEQQKARAPQAEVYFEGLAERIESTRKFKRVKLDNGNYDVYYVGYLKADSGFEYEYRTHRKKRWFRGQSQEVDEFKPTEIRNYIIQGDSSLFVQVVTGKLIRHYFKVDFYGNKCYPIMTVHDQILLDVHVDVLEQVIRETVDIMEDIPRWMKPLGYDLTMPYPVEATVGMNWQDQVSLKEAGINL